MLTICFITHYKIILWYDEPMIDTAGRDFMNNHDNISGSVCMKFVILCYKHSTGS